LLGPLVLLLVTGFVLALTTGVKRVEAAAPPEPVPAVPEPPAAGSPLDQPLKLVEEARASYQKVRDYTCLLVSQERVKGKLLPENLVEMKFREQPFSVYMRWLSPKQSAGQEVAYIAGKNKGQMRVHAVGVFGAVGFVSIDPRDKRVTEHSSHVITEAGIGNLIERFGRHWGEERRLGLKVKVDIAEYEYNKRRCWRVQTSHLERTAKAYSYRSVVYFDKQHKLPIRAEVYDWPRAGGPAGGELLETFSYADLRFNLNLPDSVFDK
jgi:hypothetical protein